MMALHVALGTVLTTVAVRRLRPVFRKDEAKPENGRANEREEAMLESRASPSPSSQAGRKPLRSWLDATCDENATPGIESAEPDPSQSQPHPAWLRLRPRCGDDPVLWKEVWATRPRPMTRVLRGLVVATMLTLTVIFCAHHSLMSVPELLEHGYDDEFENSYHRLELNVTLRYLVTITAGLMLLWVSIVAACSVAGERDKGTWLSLVSTPLAAFEIIRGKVIGAFWSLRVLLALWLTLVMLGLLLGAVHPLGVLAVTLATATYLAFGCALGIVASLHARTASRAVVSTLITLIIVNGAYLLVFLPWNIRSELPAMGVTPFVEASALMSYLDAKWLLDFEFPDNRLLTIALTCALSIALYAGATFALASWTLKSFDRVIDRPRSVAAFKGER
jgi:ABC-type transport system involved in multi-copper enzyme maturation permease subunit